MSGKINRLCNELANRAFPKVNNKFYDWLSNTVYIYNWNWNWNWKSNWNITAYKGNGSAFIRRHKPQCRLNGAACHRRSWSL